MDKAQLLEQICAEVIDLHAMDGRVGLFMSKCTNSMSKHNYTLGSLKSMIDEKKSLYISEYCSDVVRDNQSNLMIANAIRIKAESF